MFVTYTNSIPTDMRNIHPTQAQVKTDFSTDERLKEKLLDILGEKGIFKSPTTENTAHMRNIPLEQAQVKTDLNAKEKLKEKLLDKKENQGMVIGTNTNNTHGMRTLSPTNTTCNNFFPAGINFEFLGPRKTKSLKAVLGLIYYHGKCRLKVATIAKMTGFSSRTVHKCLKSLSQDNFIRYYTKRLKSGLNSPSEYYITNLGRETVERGGYALIGEGILIKPRFSAKVSQSRNEKRKQAQSALAVSLDSDLPTELLGSPIIVSKDTYNRNTSNITKEGNQKVLVKKVLQCPLEPIKTMIGTEIARNSRFVEYHPQGAKGCETLLNALVTENRWFNATTKTIAGFKLNLAELQLLFEDFFSYKRRKYSQGIMISPYLQIKLKRDLDNIESLNFEMCNFGKYWLKIYRSKLSKNQKFIKYDEYEQKRADNLLAGMQKTVKNMVREMKNVAVMTREQSKKNKALKAYYELIEKNPDSQPYIEHYINQDMDSRDFYRYLEEVRPDPDLVPNLQIFILLNGKYLRSALMELVSEAPSTKTPIIDLNVLTPFEFVE